MADVNESMQELALVARSGSALSDSGNVDIQLFSAQCTLIRARLNGLVSKRDDDNAKSACN